MLSSGGVTSAGRNYILSRNKRNAALRSLFRRLPCTTALVVNATVTGLLLLSLLSVLVGVAHFAGRRAHYDRQEEMIRERANFSAFEVCSFTNDAEFFGRNLSQYNFDNCGVYCGKMAYAFRVRTVNRSAPFGALEKSMCWNQHETVPCRDEFQNCPDPKQRAKCGPADARGQSAQRHIPFDQRKQDRRDKHGRLRLASSLKGACPVCAATSAKFGFKGTHDKAFQNFVTLTHGWPGMLTYCDEFTVHRGDPGLSLSMPIPERYKH